MEGPESPNREILSCVLIVGRRHLWNAGHRHNTREGLDEEGGGGNRGARDDHLWHARALVGDSPQQMLAE